ncbi:MAG: hypothetical protein RLZZ399_2558 [Verrucomicrobiota bacterium]
MAEAFEDFEAVEAREHEIEEDSVPGFLGGEGESFESGVDLGDAIAEWSEVLRDEPAEFAIVIDDEDTLVGGIGLRGGLHGWPGGSMGCACGIAWRVVRGEKRGSCYELFN